MLAWPQVSDTTRSNPALTFEMVAIRMATVSKCEQLLFFRLIVCVSVVSLMIGNPPRILDSFLNRLRPAICEAGVGFKPHAE